MGIDFLDHLPVYDDKLKNIFYIYLCVYGSCHQGIWSSGFGLIFF
jgi:hypothetical protein